MTYLEFHLLFNLPVILFLVWLNRSRLTVRHVQWISLLCLIVLAFTYPWDSYAVSRGIWSFTSDRIAFRIGNLPFEEVLFFLFETIAVSLTVLLFLPSSKPQSKEKGNSFELKGGGKDH